MTTRSSASARTSVDSGGAPWATSTRSPPRSLYEALAAAPSTVTRPAAIACAICDRVAASGKPASQRSSRWPRAAGGTTTASRSGKDLLGSVDVERDLRCERFRVGELLLVAQVLVELERHDFSVEVFGLREQVGLDDAFAARERRRAADRRDTVHLAAANARARDVHAVG